MKSAEEIINELPEPSWVVFDECATCGTGKQKPCYRLSYPTRLGLMPTKMPHKGRKRLKDEQL